MILILIGLIFQKNYEKILINFIYVAKRIEKIFLKFKPNTIFISSGQSNIEASIMNIFAKTLQNQDFSSTSIFL